jgi:hypothetical protein
MVAPEINVFNSVRTQNIYSLIMKWYVVYQVVRGRAQTIITL